MDSNGGDHNPKSSPATLNPDPKYRPTALQFLNDFVNIPSPPLLLQQSALSMGRDYGGHPMLPPPLRAPAPSTPPTALPPVQDHTLTYPFTLLKTFCFRQPHRFTNLNANPNPDLTLILT